jgi:hypothetical protein
MKKYFSIIGLLILFSLLTVSFNPFHAAKPYQSDQITITASGQWCESGPCGVISFSFNPNGGPVSGSISGSLRSYDSAGIIFGVREINASLSGTFAGGDGGVINGTMVGQEHRICPTCEVKDETLSLNGFGWEGHLYANGTGGGVLFLTSQWNATFSAQQFQEGLGGSASPTVDSTQSNPPLEQATAGAPVSPTVGDSQSSQNQALQILPSIQAAIQSQPTLDMAAEEILNQDGAIIARDAQGVFYAVSNEGVKKVLPQELQDRVSQDLFFLWNADLLNASPAIKALVAMNTITSTDDITGANKYFEVPAWLKERNYLKLNTECTVETCRSVFTMAILDTSWELNTSDLFPQVTLASFSKDTNDSSTVNTADTNDGSTANTSDSKVSSADNVPVPKESSTNNLTDQNAQKVSSEHASIRGTINGSGDFISYSEGDQTEPNEKPVSPDSSEPEPSWPLLPSWSSGPSEPSAPDNEDQPPLGALLFALIKPHLLANNSNIPYLGLVTNDYNNGAIIHNVQKGSPAEKEGLAIGDVVLKVNKIAVDAKNTLAFLISQHKGGDQVELEITRNGNPMSFTVKLARILPSVISTSATEITLADNTRLVIDTGFNGINGIYIREGSAHVREPISGSEVDVQAGQAIIVVPGYPIDAPITLSNEQIHDSFAKPSQSSSTETTIEFPLWYLIVFVAVIIILIVVIVVFLRKKAGRAKEKKINPPKSRKKTSRIAGKTK